MESKIKKSIEFFLEITIYSAVIAVVIGLPYFIAECNHERLALITAEPLAVSNNITNTTTAVPNLNPDRVKDVHKILNGKYFYILSSGDMINENCKAGNLSCTMTFMLGNQTLSTKLFDGTPINGVTYATIGKTNFHLAGTNTYIISSYLGDINDLNRAHEQIVQIDKNGTISISAPFNAKENQLDNSNKYKNIYSLNKNGLTILGEKHSYYKFTNGKLSEVETKT